jgi:hypothetical protein
VSNRRYLKRAGKRRLPVAVVRRAVTAAAVTEVAKGIGPSTRYCQHMSGTEKTDVVLVLAEDKPGAVVMAVCKDCAKAGGAVPIITVNGKST